MHEQRTYTCNNNNNKREKLKCLLEQATRLWQDKDASSLCSLFADSGCLILTKRMHRGGQIVTALEEHFSQYLEIKLYIKRMIIDADQMMGSVEAVVRTRSYISSIYSESQLAWMVTLLDDDQGIWRWQAWNDASSITIRSLDTPLPLEIWRPAPTSSPAPTRENIYQLLEEQMNAYTMADIHLWRECIHEDIILHPPWDVLVGRDVATKAVHVFFQNYCNTQITPLRLIYDETQPQHVVFQQIFKTSNISTGKAGEDVDFVFVEVVDGKIRYWRTYFDTTSSAQKCDKTFRQVFFQKTLASRRLSL